MYFIRTDASPSIGMGHVMRCLAIAQEVRQLGKKVTFIVSNEYSIDKIEEENFKSIIIPEKNDMMDEIPEYKGFFSSTEKNVILVDSYKASDDYLNTLSQSAEVYFIDGMLKCNAVIAGIICFNPSADLKRYEKKYAGKNTVLMIGSKYVPLRREFKSRIEHNYLPKKQVLLTTGSTDNFHITETFCSVWKRLEINKKADLHVVIGGLFKEISWLENYPGIYFHQNVQSMSTVMRDMDLAVCQAGTTVFELLSQGIPTISFAINDIQKTFSALEPKIRWVGSIDGDSRNSYKLINDLVSNVEDLLDYPDIMEQMKTEILYSFDGNGAARIATAIVNNA